MDLEHNRDEAIICQFVDADGKVIYDEVFTPDGFNKDEFEIPEDCKRPIKLKLRRKKGAQSNVEIEDSDGNVSRCEFVPVGAGQETEGQKTEG